MAFTTSPAGRKLIEQEEGVVLRAYRDVAGVWTIGAGLTAASGVVEPRAGMQITLAEADRLLSLALAENYEPAVRRAMARATGPRQHEFDAGVSFHYNTGGIAKATWVKRWIAGDWPGVERSLLAWNKAGGKVLTGLTRRREREFRLLRYGVYTSEAGNDVTRPVPPADGAAKLAAPITQARVPGLVTALVALGYASKGEEALTAAAVRRFQDAHGLTVDGIVGVATWNAIQRAVDSRNKAQTVAGMGAVSALPAAAAAGGTPVLPDIGIPGLEAFPVLAVAVWALRLAWTYRDSIAGALHLSAPRVAHWLRSF